MNAADLDAASKSPDALAHDRKAAWRRWWTTRTVFPMDPFSTLGVPRDATDPEIHAACQQLMCAVSANRWSRWQAALMGQAPARLLRARDTLLDPIARARCTAQCAWLDVFFTLPPH